MLLYLLTAEKVTCVLYGCALAMVWQISKENSKRYIPKSRNLKTFLIVPFISFV